MAYAGLRPLVLWGDWLGSEVLIGVDPVVELSGLDAADCWTPLAAVPQRSVPFTDSDFGGIGGGWATVLGYDPGTSWLAFYDSLLRRRTDGTWVFESLGLSGREQAADLHLDLARAAVSTGSVAPQGTEGRKGTRSWVPRVGAGIGPLSPIDDHESDRHLAGVERVIGRIRAGEVYQLNLCTRFRADVTEPPLELFVRTAGRLRPAYGAQLPTGPNTTLVSLSPERFLTVRDGVVITSPIKGTTKRTEDPDGSRLRSSTKDAAENIMITDLMRNDLSRVCVPGSVTVTGLLEVEAHPGIWHLVSTVQGELPGPATTDSGGSGTGIGELLAATFPPGSVTGAPKSSATAAIALEEPHHRGAYTGAAGLITVDGRAELSVLIRTFEVTGDQVELGVGGGITVDSVPVREWQECLHKAEPLARAAGSRLIGSLDEVPAPVPVALAAAGVFESILVQYGRTLRLADHLARLARSVRELYGAELPDELAARALEYAGEVATQPRAALRVHARPSAAEPAIGLSVRPLGPRLRRCALAVATRPAHSWRHKWADRAPLQAAEDESRPTGQPQPPEDQPAPTLPYFLDPSGRLAETSRGNLFVLDLDGIWRTPPANDHLLPGVTRRALLDELSDRQIPCELAPIGRAQLATAVAAVWTSSLSGVVEITAVDGRRLAHPSPAETWSGWLGLG